MTDNFKKVHNLRALVLARLRQHAFLASLMDRAIQLAGSDRALWRQYGLALGCSGRIQRAITVLRHGAALKSARSVDVLGGIDDQIVEHMSIARLLIELPTDDSELAMSHANQALQLCRFNELTGRCMLLYALAFSIKARSEITWEARREALNKSIENFERAVEFDSRDDLTHFFCALEYAEVRNLAAARDCCLRALERNPFNASAAMLMALLFTAKHDYKNALKLVHEHAANFPGHYGLLVLRLRLESRFGRLDRALQTSRHMLSFWRRSTSDEPSFADDISQATVQSLNGNLAAGSVENGSVPTAMTIQSGSLAHLTSKNALGPVTPIFTAPLGITSAALSPHMTVGSWSALNLSEVASNLGPAATRSSEHGASAASTISDSLGIGTSSSLAWSASNSFRLRANIWVEVAELFMDADSLPELSTCVEEAFALFPGSYQVMYLKGRIALIRAEAQATTVDVSMASPILTGTSGDTQKPLYTEARTHFLAALAVNPTHVQSFRWLAVVYRAERNLKMAEKMLREAATVDPLNETVWQELGRVLAEQNCFEEANDCFQAAASVHGTSPLMPFEVIPRVLKSCF